ncbi:MAG: hypothetical protein RLZZ618_2962 [Pseudomonadota bacterium]
MIYKFKSKAGADILMMGPNGDELLRLIGKPVAPKGILEPDAMPAALAALEQAVAADDAARTQAEAEAAAEGKTLPPREGVGLRQRVWPFVETLKRAHTQGHDIVWGV